MSSHSPCDNVSERAVDSERAEVAVVRRVDGRKLRKSCDRCHQQKLRCVGDKVSLTRCKRCQRTGLECVYGARYSKKASQCSINTAETWDNGPAYFAGPTLNDPMDELDTMLGLDSTQLNDVFSITPSAWPATGDEVFSMAPNSPAPERSSGTFVSSAISMPLLSSDSSSEAGDEPMTEFADLSAELANAFQKLETIFIRTTDDQTSGGIQNYPIGEVLSAFDDFLGVLQLDNMVGTSTSCIPQSPRNVYLRSNRASIAAQGYVLCARLLGSLSEQMLQSLLASPLRSASGNSANSDSTQNVSDSRTDRGSSGRHFLTRVMFLELFD